MKICLLPGHSPADGGSELVSSRVSEYRFARGYIDAVAAELRGAGHEVVITERAAAGGKTPSYSALAANTTDADVAVELHFNAAGATATGAEWLYFAPSARSSRVAAAMLAEWCRLSGLKNRGVLPCVESAAWAKAHGFGGRYDERGFAAFKKSRMPFFMAEPFFGSNPQEAAVMEKKAKSGELARWMSRAILAGLELL